MPNVLSPDVDEYNNDTPILAIIVLSITGAIAGVYFGYRIYKFLWRRRHLTQPFLTSEDIQEERKEERKKEPPPGYASGAYILAGSDYNVAGRVNNPGSIGNRSPSPYTPPDDSDLGSPISPHDNMSPFPYSGSRGAFGSSGASFLGPNATSNRPRYSTVPHSGSSAASISNASTSGPTRTPKLSGAPHSPYTRFEIVPPQPLGAPPGSVVAADKSTLAFSAKSGLSGGDPAEQNPANEDRLFDPEEIMRRDQDQKQKGREFAAAKAAYLTSPADAREQSQDSRLSNSTSSGGPFRDSAEWDSNENAQTGGPYSNHQYQQQQHYSPQQDAAAAYFSNDAVPPTPPQRDDAGQRRSTASDAIDMPSSPLEKLQYQLQEQAQRGRSSGQPSSRDENGFT